MSVFNSLTIGYLFLGGAGGGALAFLCVAEFVRALHPAHYSEAEHTKLLMYPEADSLALGFPAFLRRAWPICLVALVFAILCLLFDLGRPDRVLQLFTSPRPTPVSVGTFALAMALIAAMFFCVTALSDKPLFSPAAVKTVAVLGFLSGIVTATYTGLLLQILVSVMFWNTPLLPVLFLLSSLSCGIACLFLAAVFVNPRHAIIRLAQWLARADLVVIAIEAICLMLYLLLASGSTDTSVQASVAALESGEYAWLFWMGLVVCGMAVPCALECHLSRRNFRTQVLWIAALVLTGGLVLRICFVGVGAYDVTQIGTQQTEQQQAWEQPEIPIGEMLE